MNAQLEGFQSVGALVGYFKGDGSHSISNSYSTGTIVGNSVQVGGLVGVSDGGTYLNDYSTATVSGVVSVGGLIGRFRDGSVSKSYAKGNITGTNSGGLIGYTTGNISVSDCNVSVSTNGSAYGGPGRIWRSTDCF